MARLSWLLCRVPRQGQIDAVLVLKMATKIQAIKKAKESQNDGRERSRSRG